MSEKRAITERDIERVICNIAGLDPGNVRKITLVLEVGKAPLLTIEQYASATETDALIKTLSVSMSRYVLSTLSEKVDDGN